MRAINDSGQIVNDRGETSLGVEVQSRVERIINIQTAHIGETVVLFGLGDMGNLYTLKDGQWVGLAIPPVIMRLIDNDPS